MAGVGLFTLKELVGQTSIKTTIGHRNTSATEQALLAQAHIAKREGLQKSLQ
jgi:hypothetical protein